MRQKQQQHVDSRWARRLRVALLVLASSASLPAQLTTSDNQLWDENAFHSAAEQNRFGSALAVCDFDGDGYDDLAIGARGADVLGLIDSAGAVHVAYGSDAGLTNLGHQTFTQPATSDDPPEQSDLFGSALAAADFDGDGYCDLAVGAPFDNVNGAIQAGTVHLFYGSGGGLITSSSQLLTQDTPSIETDPEFNDQFGSTLAAADFDLDGYADLVVATPYENRPAHADSGMVDVLFGTAEGITTVDGLVFRIGQGIDGTADEYQYFGFAVAVGLFDGDAHPDLAIGAYGADVNGVPTAGRVFVLYSDEEGFINNLESQTHLDQQDLGLALEPHDGFGRALAAGDFNGDGIDELVISSWEGVGTPGAEAENAGSVAVLLGTPDGPSSASRSVFTQDTTGISDQAEPGDWFGFGIVGGDFDGNGLDDLAIGVHREDLGTGGASRQGAVHVVYGTGRGLRTDGEQFHGQSGWKVGATEDGDGFGEILAAGDFDADGVDELVVGVPYENRAEGANAGVVAVITGVRTPFIFEDGFESGDTTPWSTTSP